jgi:signal transduction histidine kinase
LVHSRNSLLVALVITTAVVTAALSWAGWRLLSQQRDIDKQLAQEQLGTTAEAMAAAIRGKLAESGEQLSAAIANPAVGLPVIPSAAVLASRPNGTVTAARGLPFVPAVPDTSGIDQVFDEAEAFEFAKADLPAAASRYQALTRHTDGTVRAGAFLRLARVAEKRGDTPSALRAYQQIEQSGTDLRFKHLPVQFVALYQQHAIAVDRNDQARVMEVAARLTAGLDSGQWLLTRRDATYYREQLGLNDPPGTWALADAVERAWEAGGSPLPSRGQRVFNDGARSVLVMWRANDTSTAMMAAFLDEFLPAAPGDTSWHLADPAGRWMAGDRSIPTGATAPRVVGDSEYAWMLHVGSGATGYVRGSERPLVAMMAAMLVFLWGAMYFMARAIRREAAVARLQSDFVAAVSHEFRSPLTTIRQMAEMLEMGRVTSHERRQDYYTVLTGEASRLQRLVETLLNFGRMEAGAARYRLEELDAAAVVRRVVQESEPAARESGRHIVMTGPETVVPVRADGSALALAVRNLVDNALKYSPDQPEIRVECGHDYDRAWIRVIDRGIGIPRAEQQAIFDKFVRGRSAIEGNVAGTGVGLAIVRQILRAHGGDVDVESEVGQGSTFTLVLPLSNARRPSPRSEEAVVHS